MEGGGGDLNVVNVACQREPGDAVHEVALPQRGSWPCLPCTQKHFQQHALERRQK